MGETEPVAPNVVLIFSRHCSFDCVEACLNTAREFGVEPTWYHGIPPPIPPATNTVVLEARSDIELATMIVVVNGDLPVTPAWLKPDVARRVERGARLFEYLFATDTSSIGDVESATTASSVEELQNFLRTAFRSTIGER